MVPGISSGPFGSPFDEVVEDVRGEFGVVRVDAWEGAEDLEGMNLKMLHARLYEAFELLKSNGCESVGLLGKSFGGQLGLTWPGNDQLDFMVLWAPAIGFGEYNVDKWRSERLGKASEATDISVDEEYLESIDMATLIIHGTRDEVVSVENSRRICDALPNCNMETVEGADHSFKGFSENVAELTLRGVLR
ncbi:MAG: alpha/beta hydrolase [Candidatus Nanohaloarchaea archaeon]